MSHEPLPNPLTGKDIPTIRVMELASRDEAADAAKIVWKIRMAPEALIENMVASLDAQAERQGLDANGVARELDKWVVSRARAEGGVDVEMNGTAIVGLSDGWTRTAEVEIHAKVRGKTVRFERRQIDIVREKPRGLARIVALWRLILGEWARYISRTFRRKHA